jgi:uncharacterized protein
MNRKTFLYALVPVVACSMPWASEADAQEVLRIGGGSPGSSVQAGAVGLSILLNDQSEGRLRTTALGTDGATANIRLVESGEAQLGMTAATSLYSSLQGTEVFAQEEPYTNWRAVVPQGFVPLYGVTTRGTGITQLADIEGRPVSLGPAGSGTGATWSQILPEMGISGDFRHMPFAEGNERLRDGLIDAHLIGVTRIAAALEAESYLGEEAVWFGIDDPEHQEAAMGHFPALSQVTLPAGIYETQTEPLETIGYSLWVIAHKDVSDEAIKEVTRLIVEQGEGPLEGYGAWGEVWAMDLIPSFDILSAIGAKLHPGSVAYFEESGIEVPDDVRPE